jgi:hypothetical protein
MDGSLLPMRVSERVAALVRWLGLAWLSLAWLGLL